MTKLVLTDQAAAFLSSCIIAKSEKIESTRFAVELWDDLRKRLKIETRLDYLAAILSQGRLMDLKVKTNDYLGTITETYNMIRDDLVIKLTYPILGEDGGVEILAESYIVRLNDIGAAMIASAVTDLSQKVETSKEIIEIWDKIRQMDIVDNNNEFINALFVASRINDLKKEIKDVHDLSEIMDNFKAIMENQEPELKVTRKHLAAAYLTIAMITQTPEIESHAEILEVWRKFRRELRFEDKELDIITSILTGGLIRNMTLKLDFAYIKDLFNRIRKRLLEMNVE
ncbi:hypothetical protein [[Eubacterium] cellulosolvens]